MLVGNPPYAIAVCAGGAIGHSSAAKIACVAAAIACNFAFLTHYDMPRMIRIIVFVVS
jgi:hypothetical protein